MKKLLLLSFLMAIVFTLAAQSDGDYRSKATGNWETAATWEISSSGSWSTATTAPGSSISVTVTILNGHTVTFGSTASNLTIASGGALVIDNGEIGRAHV